MPEPETSPIKFPLPRPSSRLAQLILPRRRAGTASRSPFEISEASATARETISAIVAATRAPDSPIGEPEQAAELHYSLRQLDLDLSVRERRILESESRLADYARDLAEMEALLMAREDLLAVARQPVPLAAAISTEERAALDNLRVELERQTASLNEAKQAQRERELFIDESENKLFEKVQEQQEKEIQLEQREDDLRSLERRLREREAAIDPEVAAKLQIEDAAAKNRDEFKE